MHSSHLDMFRCVVSELDECVCIERLLSSVTSSFDIFNSFIIYLRSSESTRSLLKQLFDDESSIMFLSIVMLLTVNWKYKKIFVTNLQLFNTFYDVVTPYYLILKCIYSFRIQNRKCVNKQISIGYVLFVCL